MPVSLTEKNDSRKVTTASNGDAQSAEFVYTLTGVADENSARILATNSTASTYGDLIRKSISLEPVHVDTANLDTCIWEVTVQYGEKDEPESGDPSTFSFDTGGGTQHITQSLSTIGKYTASGTAPDFKGAIGVTHDNVEGVDITVPVYQFTETHYLSAAQVTPAYKGTLFYLTGKVNNASFRGLAAGECLFLGASGSQRGPDEDWEITFKFAGSPNRTGITVGPITGIAKKGWEYLWVRYADTEDAASNTLVKQPVAAYVEKVYEDGSFSGLGIGS
jgi:hypothetical protein